MSARFCWADHAFGALTQYTEHFAARWPASLHLRAPRAVAYKKTVAPLEDE